MQVFDDNGEISFCGIVDNREEPGGMIFEDDSLSKEKTNKVSELRRTKIKERLDILGYIIQPAK